MTEAAAIWAVASWAMALGVISKTSLLYLNQKTSDRLFLSPKNRFFSNTPKYQLRSQLLIVSDREIRKVFKLDKNRIPLKYIINEYEDNKDGTITDHATGLVWQQSGSDKSMKYEEAQIYVRQLNYQQFAGHSNWRLPTIEELMSLLEPDEQSNHLYIAPLFDNRQWWCWSSDVYEDRLLLWHVLFYDGYVYYLEKSSGHDYVRCVTDGKSKQNMDQVY